MENKLTIQNVKKNEYISQYKVKKNKHSKSKILDLAFLLLNIMMLVIVLVIQSSTDGITSLSTIKKSGAQLIYIVYTFLTFLIILILESLKNYIFLLNATKRRRPIVSYKTMALEKYYDSLTPFGVGGKPYSIFYLIKHDVRPSVATLLPIAKFVFGQLAILLVSIIVLLSNQNVFRENTKIVFGLAILSLVVIFLSLVGVVFLARSKKIAPKLIVCLLNLMQKMRILKNRDLLYEKLMNGLREYQNSMKYYATHFCAGFSYFVISILSIVFKAVLTYMIYLSFSPIASASFGTIFAKIILCDLVARLIPLPGGVGVVEISFNALFSSLFSSGTLFWAILIYRIFTYYLYLLQGILIEILDFLCRTKITHKHKID